MHFFFFQQKYKSWVVTGSTLSVLIILSNKKRFECLNAVSLILQPHQGHLKMSSLPLWTLDLAFELFLSKIRHQLFSLYSPCNATYPPYVKAVCYSSGPVWACCPKISLFMMLINRSKLATQPSNVQTLNVWIPPAFLWGNEKQLELDIKWRM